MDFGNQTKSRRFKRSIDVGKKTDYSQVLQFYELPPTENVSLQEFEDLAVERLKVLKAVENMGIKYVKGRQEYNDALEKELKEKVKINWVLNRVKGDTERERKESVKDNCRRDHISHFVLRLAYCKSEELRRWFLTQEIDLFKFRFAISNHQEVLQFLKRNNLNYLPISEGEKNEIREYILDATYGITAVTFESTDFYKVDYLQVLDLVSKRKSYLSGGYAYVPQTDLISVVVTEFREKLSKGLSLTAKALPGMEEDFRLLPMLNSLSQRYLGSDYNCKKKGNADAVTADMVDDVAKRHFPPCMMQLQQHLRQEHHMKHDGRQQYGLFLKGIGLSLEEALKFWRMEFTKKIDVDKFDKQYSYNIRHNYGKEGKRTNYTPQGCMKIISANIGSGDAHGCPFRHSDADLVRQKLQAMKINKEGQNEVMTYVKDGHCQLACGRLFEVVRNLEKGSVAINHPNQFYDESYKLEHGTKNPQSQNSTPSSVRSRPMSQTPSSTPGAGRNTTPSVKPPVMDDFEDIDMSEDVLQKMEASA